MCAFGNDVCLRHMNGKHLIIDRAAICIISERSEETSLAATAAASLIITTSYVIIIKKEGVSMTENKLADLSTEFAVNILKLTDSIKGHYSLANQLERSGTSIGANIREAKYPTAKLILLQNCRSV